MTDFKTYEYIWLDGYTPEANMRSKVKATDEDTARQTGLLMVHQHYKQKEEVQIVFSCLCKLTKTPMGMT